MNCILRGIKNVDYVSRKDGEQKKGIELHCERKPFPTENFIGGSDVCFTEYIPINQNTKELIARVLSIPMLSEISLIYVQNGRYSSLVDVEYNP